jgi:predicted SAM-dependent methyltransferase
MSKDFIEHFKIIGLKSSLGNIMRETIYLMFHLKGVLQARRYKNSSDLKLHVGCGKKIKPGWVNIDLKEKRADISFDIRKPLPLSNDCCSIVYSEHLLEHLIYPREAKHFIEESFRVLKSGGIISIGGPDTEWSLRAYFEGEDADFFSYAKKKESWFYPKWCKTRMEFINFHFRFWGHHCFAYDSETLQYLLKKCGFINVKKRDFDRELDGQGRNLGTLYVDGIKP